ncbi:hypothetical protein QFZ22_003771 [Streptomyces canus]|uniref:Tape measure protein n=1 Tax=Streptomyces canus TaxID=58343 RepID=A0AAW8FCD2_9ACTN|nr:hypothetical protein [Streptomyces canus]MDQ0907786.1 hypothetical protein [Streptomyces canus]
MAQGFKIASAWVDISADTSNLKRDAKAGIVRELKGLSANVQLKASAVGLKGEARRKVREALTGLSSDVRLKVDSGRLRASAEAAVNRATRGLNGAFELKFNAGALRTDLKARIKTASKGLKIHIPIKADATGLRAELRAAIAAAQAGLDIDIPVNLRGEPILRSITQVNNAAGGMSRRMRMWASAIVAGMGGIAPAIGTVLNVLQAVGPAALVSVPMVTSLALVLGTVAVGGNGVAHAIAMSAESSKQFNQALSKLTPEAQSFVKAVVSSKGAFKDMQSAVQDVLFSGLDDSFRSMAKQVLPDLMGGLGGTAVQLNQMAKSSMSVVQSLSQTGTLKQAFGGLMMAFKPIIPMPGQFLNMVTKTTIAATPLFTRMTTAMGSGVDKLNAKVDQMFASGELQGNIDRSAQSITDFFRKIGNNPEWQTFVNKIKTTGPELAQTLGRISEALLKLMNNAGPLFAIVLKVADGFARLVNAIPDGVIATILGVAGAMKIMGLAAAGWKLVTGSAAVASLTRFVTAARMTGVASAITGVASSMTLLQKASVVLAVVAGGIAILKHFSDANVTAAPNVDKLAMSLGKLSTNGGKFTGELAKTFTNVKGMSEAFDTLNGGIKKNIGGWEKLMGDTSVSDWTRGVIDNLKNGDKSIESYQKKLDGVDQALADMVQSGHGDLAAAAIQKMGINSKDSQKYLKDYQGALDDQKKADELAAISMGVFGDAAITTSQKLAQLKSDTDGLARSLFALNDTNRSAVDALGDWEAAGDALAAQAKKRAGDLSYENGIISQNTQAQRDNVDALNDYAVKTQAAGMASYQSNGNWTQSLGIWQRGHAELVRQGQAMGLNSTQAKAYADAILKIPSQKQIDLQMVGQAQQQLDSVVAAFKAAPSKKTITVETLSATATKVLQDLGYKVTKLPDGRFSITANDKNAKGKLDALSKYKVSGKDVKVTAATQTALGQLDGVIKKVKATPGAKSVTVSTLNKPAIDALEKVGLKVKKLPDGKFSITASTGAASKSIAGIQAQRDRLSGKTITITTRKVTIIDTLKGQSLHDVVGATGGLGSKLKGYAGGGSIAGGVLQGAGTKTSDSLIARLSKGEFVMRAAAVDKYGPAFMDAINSGNFPGFAAGGYSKKRTVGKGSKKHTEYLYQGQWMTKDQYDKAHGAANELSGDTTFSHFGQMAKAQGSFKDNEFENKLGQPASIESLVGDLNKYRGLIQTSTSGKTESTLLKKLDSSGKALLAQQKKLEGVNSALDKAKDKLSSLKDSFNQLKDSIKGNILSFGSVTKAGKWGTNPQNILNQLQTDVTKSGAFAGQLDQLKAKGVDPAIIKQIAEAGISGGGAATAASLLQMTPEQLAKLNELQKQLTANADKAGQVTADAMYGAGIDAAEGLVKGLESQKKAIEAVMMSIAKSMEAAIKKALGIKSPSRVMMKLGGFTATGFAQGIAARASEAVAASRALAAIPASIGAGVPSQARTRASVPVAGGRSSVTHIGAINVNVSGTFDFTKPSERRAIAQALVREIKEEIRLDDKKRR